MGELLMETRMSPSLRARNMRVAGGMFLLLLLLLELEVGAEVRVGGNASASEVMTTWPDGARLSSICRSAALHSTSTVMPLEVILTLWAADSSECPLLSGKLLLRRTMGWLVLGLLRKRFIAAMGVGRALPRRRSANTTHDHNCCPLPPTRRSPWGGDFPIPNFPRS